MHTCVKMFLTIINSRYASEICMHLYERRQTTFKNWLCL